MWAAAVGSWRFRRKHWFRGQMVEVAEVARSGQILGDVERGAVRRGYGHRGILSMWMKSKAMWPMEVKGSRPSSPGDKTGAMEAQNKRPISLWDGAHFQAGKEELVSSFVLIWSPLPTSNLFFILMSSVFCFVFRFHT